MQHKIHLELDIVFDSHWHTGSGEGSLLTDRLVCLNSKKQPYIPATTLKGVIRHNCEKISAALKFPEASDPHQVDIQNTEAFVPFSQMNSPVDRIFGTKFAGGSLFFRDAVLKEGVLPEKSSVRTRTARYRVLKTAKTGHLFSTEYNAPAVFSTIIDGWHEELISFDESLPPYAYCVLVAGILATKRIGGDKSTGTGCIKQINLLNFIYNDREMSLNDTGFCENFFDLLDASADYVELMAAGRE
jgi:CRISPR/Cas system CSM-associated protein Csm3 (group 7 of RAMP superfamily)